MKKVILLVLIPVFLISCVSYNRIPRIRTSSTFFQISFQLPQKTSFRIKINSDSAWRFDSLSINNSDPLIKESDKENVRYPDSGSNVLSGNEFRFSHNFNKCPDLAVELIGDNPDESTPRKHPLSIAALILSIVGFVFGLSLLGAFVSLCGIICGVLALDLIRKNPLKYKGKGLAIAAISLAAINLGLLILSVFYVW